MCVCSGGRRGGREQGIKMVRDNLEEETNFKKRREIETDPQHRQTRQRGEGGKGTHADDKGLLVLVI